MINPPTPKLPLLPVIGQEREDDKKALQVLSILDLNRTVLIPIPYGTKAPKDSGWQNTTLADMKEVTHLHRLSGKTNIGVILGKASDYLCVIDIDEDMAVEPFLEANPLLKNTLRTKGNRGCSFWVRINGDYPKSGRLTDSEGKAIMEWRADKQQSVIHGQHPTGHAYQILNTVTPIEIKFEEIVWPQELRHPWQKAIPVVSQPLATSRTTVLEHAKEHVSKMPAAVSGEGGHNTTFAVACALVGGFGLSSEEALPILGEYNQRCVPPWNTTEMRHKLDDAIKVTDRQHRGYLLPPVVAPGKPMIQLPGNSVSITQSAEQIFALISPHHELFLRGKAIFEVTTVDQKKTLSLITPSAFRSRVEAYGKTMALRVGKNEAHVWKESVMPEETAKAILDAKASRLLPKIVAILNCPILKRKGEQAIVLEKGYDAETGLLIVSGETPLNVPLKKAVVSLHDVLSEFDFQTPGDRSRAMASLLSPAFKLGGHILGKVPADVAEADQSQSGKTYRQRVIAAIYNEKPSLIVQRTGGVGSLDESFAQQLVSGHPFLQIDNLRGKFDSPQAESFLTADGFFPARLPHSKEVQIDPNWFFIFLTSNGVNTTKDFANRSNIIRIRKRVGHQFRNYAEGDLLSHVQANQPYYLGCVFAVIREWISKGCLKTTEKGHDFREWVQIMDWTMQHVMGEAPLMQGHQEIQEQISNPALVWLREVALRVDDEKRLNEELSATALAEVCDQHALHIPGLKSEGEGAAVKQVGVVMARLFTKESPLTVDAYRVIRTERLVPRDDLNGTRTQRVYRFEKNQMQDPPKEKPPLKAFLRI